MPIQSIESSGGTPDILKRICADKRREISAIGKSDRLDIEKHASDAAAPRRFAEAIEHSPGIAVIAEVKKASPSAGIISPDFDPASLAEAYSRGGARCISVLTDEKYFSGSIEYLRTVRDTVDLPILRKDFILDEIQVTQSRAFGADCVLLIVSALDDGTLKNLLDCARHWGLDALVEVHSSIEMQRAAACGATMIGINNRNLHTFEVDIAITERLAAEAPGHAVLVSESGIRGRADIKRLAGSGIDAVLIGESLMRACDTERSLRSLVGVEKHGLPS